MDVQPAPGRGELCRERLVVAITGGLGSDILVRRAHQIAARVGAELLGVHILHDDGLAGADPAALARCRALAEGLGASFHAVIGEDIPAALLDFARGVDATQLVLGISRRSRLARLINQGSGATVVQRSGSIDVRLVTHEAAGTGVRLLLYSLTLADRANVITLVLMLLVAMVVDRAARRAEQAARARTEASLLASYARTVLADPDPLPRLLEKIRETFAFTSVALLEHHDGEWRLAACTGVDPCPHPDRALAAAL
jgi:K+-sensing histidine kinase KdpD